VLPLVQAFADGDLSVRAPNYVYANLTSSVWLAYSPAAGRVLAILATVMLAIATWRRWQGLGQFVGAIGIVAVALIAIVAFDFGVLALADQIAGTRVAWPAAVGWRLLLYATPVFALSMLRPLVHRIGRHTWLRRGGWVSWLARAWPAAYNACDVASVAGANILLFAQRPTGPPFGAGAALNAPSPAFCWSFTSEKCKADVAP
jgi:hypothetical protein